MIRTLLAISMVFIPAFYCLGQEIYYYGANSRPFRTEQEAVSVTKVDQKSENRYVINKRIRVNDSWIDVERQKIRIDSDGTFRIRIKGERLFPQTIYRQITASDSELYYFEETDHGSKIRTGSSSRYLPLQLEGMVTEYHPNGREKSVSFYQNNQLQSNQNWLSDGNPYIDSIFYSADQEPVYQPGVAYFNSFLLEELGKSEINLNEYDDDIVIAWVVMETGVIDGAIAMKGKSLEMNKLLCDIISRTPGEWKPAMLNGDPVRYFMSIPVNITHDEVKFQELEYTWGVLHYNRY